MWSRLGAPATCRPLLGCCGEGSGTVERVKQGRGRKASQRTACGLQQNGRGACRWPVCSSQRRSALPSALHHPTAQLDSMSSSQLDRLTRQWRRGASKGNWAAAHHQLNNQHETAAANSTHSTMENGLSKGAWAAALPELYQPLAGSVVRGAKRAVSRPSTYTAEAEGVGGSVGS